MGLLQFNPPAVSSIPTIARRFPHTSNSLKFLRHCRLFAIATNHASSSDGSAAPADNDESPSIDFAFVHVSPARSGIDIIPRVGLLMTRRWWCSRGWCRTACRTCITGRPAAGRSWGTSCWTTTSIFTGHMWVCQAAAQQWFRSFAVLPFD